MPAPIVYGTPLLGGLDAYAQQYARNQEMAVEQAMQQRQQNMQLFQSGMGALQNLGQFRSNQQFQQQQAKLDRANRLEMLRVEGTQAMERAELYTQAQQQTALDGIFIKNTGMTRSDFMAQPGIDNNPILAADAMRQIGLDQQVAEWQAQNQVETNAAREQAYYKGIAERVSQSTAGNRQTVETYIQSLPGHLQDNYQAAQREDARLAEERIQAGIDAAMSDPSLSFQERAQQIAEHRKALEEATRDSWYVKEVQPPAQWEKDFQSKGFSFDPETGTKLFPDNVRTGSGMSQQEAQFKQQELASKEAEAAYKAHKEIGDQQRKREKEAVEREEERKKIWAENFKTARKELIAVEGLSEEEAKNRAIKDANELDAILYGGTGFGNVEPPIPQEQVAEVEQAKAQIQEQIADIMERARSGKISTEQAAEELSQLRPQAAQLEQQ